jgi:hypothetical protein
MQTYDPVQALFDRASDAGITMSAICERAGVAQSTPSRWKVNRDSATLATVRKLDEALSDIIASRKEAA